MEAIIFIGIQASGKSTYYKARFSDSHIRINLDMLRTRNRERIMLEACIAAKQPFVVDNTNATAETRERYIAAAHAGRFEIIAYYFETTSADAVARNRMREERWRVPERGIYGTSKQLEPPTFAEGFDRIFIVRLHPELRFITEETTHEE